MSKSRIGTIASRGLSLVIFAMLISANPMQRRLVFRCARAGPSSPIDRCLARNGINPREPDAAYRSSLPIEQANIAVTEILRYSNLPYKKFNLTACESIDNALSVIDKNGTSHILYDPEFMDRANRSFGVDRGAWFWLAHEIAHHLYGHILNDAGPAQIEEQEMEADEFAVYVMFKVGVRDLRTAQAAIRAEFGENTRQRQDRLARVEEGFEKAKHHETDPRSSPGAGQTRGDGGFNIICGGNNNVVSAGESVLYQIIITSNGYRGPVWVKLNSADRVEQVFRSGNTGRVPGVYRTIAPGISSRELRIDSIPTSGAPIRVNVSPDTPPGSYRLTFSAGTGSTRVVSSECMLTVR